jgi:hypothetical protein
MKDERVSVFFFSDFHNLYASAQKGTISYFNDSIIIINNIISCFCFVKKVSFTLL